MTYLKSHYQFHNSMNKKLEYKKNIQAFHGRCPTHLLSKSTLNVQIFLIFSSSRSLKLIFFLKREYCPVTRWRKRFLFKRTYLRTSNTSKWEASFTSFRYYKTRLQRNNWILVSIRRCCWWGYYLWIKDTFKLYSPMESHFQFSKFFRGKDSVSK